MLARTLKIILLLLISRMLFAQSAPHLGRIHFHTSNNKNAQQNFENGVLLLHSFEYAEARVYFQRTIEFDPTDWMAYWGEAMTYNHPIWNEQDLKAGRQVLHEFDRASKNAHFSEKEKGYLEAIHLLYGTLDKVERDKAYSQAMFRLYKQYPEDDEIAVFYALSILGTAEKVRDFAIYMRAAAILEEVYARNNEHPGAAHYLIHSYDDAIHAPLGLRAARTYARIAPAASHALHMPSHIFLAMGMWGDVISSNQAAWLSGEKRRKSCQATNSHDNMSELGDDLHALQWLQYGYLQKNEFKKAYALTLIARDYAMKDPSPLTKWYYALMRAAYLSESEHYLADLKPIDVNEMALAPRANDAYVNTMVALKKGESISRLTAKVDAFEKSIPADVPLSETAHSYHTAITKTGIQAARVVIAELRAEIKLKENKVNDAIALLRQASKIEDEMPLTYGPPIPIKPSHELLAEVFLQENDFSSARAEFESELKQIPHRVKAEIQMTNIKD